MSGINSTQQQGINVEQEQPRQSNRKVPTLVNNYRENEHSDCDCDCDDETSINTGQEQNATHPPSPNLSSSSTTHSLSTTVDILHQAFGSPFIPNDGTNDNGGISDNEIWQMHWTTIANLPCQHYDLPRGKPGQTFINTLAHELDFVVSCQTNSERFLAFPTMILQRSPDVQRAADIRMRITCRLQAWENQQHAQLYDDTILSNKILQNNHHRLPDNPQCHKTFHAMMLQRKTRVAV